MRNLWGLMTPTFFAKTSSNNSVQKLQNCPEVQNKIILNNIPEIPGASGGHPGHHRAFYLKMVAGDYSILGGLWALGPWRVPVNARISGRVALRQFYGIFFIEKNLRFSRCFRMSADIVMLRDDDSYSASSSSLFFPKKSSGANWKSLARQVFIHAFVFLAGFSRRPPTLRIRACRRFLETSNL